MRSDPEKARAWRERSVQRYREKQRSKPRSRVAAKSTKRRSQEATRAAVRAAVILRAGNRCEYAEVIPEVECGSPFASRPRLEVDEIRGGAFRSSEWLDPDRCKASCQLHHDAKTAHKREVIRRLAGLEPACLRCGFIDRGDHLERTEIAHEYPCARCQIGDEMAAELERRADGT